MASKFVTSPAGETIEIVPDDDWMTLTGGNEYAIRQWHGSKGMKPLTLIALWEHGEFTDAAGRVPNQIYQWIQQRYPGRKLAGQNYIMGQFRNPVNNLAIEAHINGKRTHKLKLVTLPETWHRKLLKDIQENPAPKAKPEPEPTPEPTPEPAPEPEPTPAIDLEIANQVAMSLLTTVVDIISTGQKVGQDAVSKVQEELGVAQGLLAARLAENQKLRSELRDTGEELQAVKLERDGLRTRLRQAEHNLTAALKGETATAVNDEIHKRIDQIMRTAPTSKGE